MSAQHSQLHAVEMLLRGNPDSEESISDDEDAVAELHDVVPNNVVSFDEAATNKQELPLLMRLDLLKGISNQNLAGRGRSSYLSLEKPLEDEVEMPDFKEDDFSRVSGQVVPDSSDEDIDGDSNVLSTRHFHKYGPQFIRNDQVKDTNGNSEALLCFKGSTSCSISHATCSKANIPDNRKGTQFNNNGQRRGKAMQRFQKNSKSHLQDKVVEKEDSPEPLDSGSSSDNELGDRHMEINYPRKTVQTMADRFQEALGSSSIINEGSHAGAPNSLRTGIFGKLQQLMQKEKEIDMEFWKKLQAGSKPDSELGCVDVKIISRYLDGKLTVCHCSFDKCTESFLLQYEGTGFGGIECSQCTIIFSPRVCNNVDLEVGNFIRIHPPWKEVQVGNDNIILCTYFSEISYPV